MGHDDNALRRLVAEEQSRHKRRARNLAILAVAMAAGFGSLVYALKELARDQPPKVQIEVSKLPPVRPSPRS